MCYLVREQQAAPQPGGFEPAPGAGPDRLRPRWVGAALATLVGGVALAAALVTPPAAAPVVNKDAAAPVAARSAVVPAGRVVEQGAAGVDDGVPGDSGVVKASRGGECHHGL